MSAETQLTEVLTEENFSIVFTVSNDIPRVLPEDTVWTFTSSLSGKEVVIDNSTDERFQFSSRKLTLTITGASLLDEGVYSLRTSNPAGFSSDYSRVRGLW